MLFEDVGGDIVYTVGYEFFCCFYGIYRPTVDLNTLFVAIIHKFFGNGFIIDVQTELMLCKTIYKFIVHLNG